MNHKYIQFIAENWDLGGYEDMSLSHTGAFTPLLAEYWDSSDNPLPEPGYRPTEYFRLEEFAKPDFTGSTTHRKVGDWEVTRVEVYSANSSGNEFDTIAICYCRYSPISAPLVPVPQAKVNQDSFATEEEYQAWQAQQKEKDAMAPPSRI